MPADRLQRPGTLRAVVVGLAGLAAAVATMLLMLWLAGSSDKVDVRLGDRDFRHIDTTALAAEIAENGPVPFPDLMGRDRPIWVTHDGGTDETGWSAFLARVPGREATCLVQWDPSAERFVDPCDPSTTYPPDGRGLSLLRWEVADGELRIDINRPIGED